MSGGGRHSIRSWGSTNSTCGWGNLKSTELANLCSDTIGEVADIAEGGLDRIGSDAALCLAFLHHSGLRL